MALDYKAALAAAPVEIRQSYSKRDTILYALGIGLGADPLDREEIAFLYEKDLKVLPTMPVILAASSLRTMNLAIDYGKLLHGEQRLRIYKPLAPDADVVGKSRVVDIIDRGREKGALVFIDRELTDAATGELLATIGMTAFCRGDGGCGGSDRATPPVHAIPDRAPDHVVAVKCDERAALIYRLSGDYNPLHIDPLVAKAAGFERPILHGLATFGIIGWSITKTILNYDPTRLLELGGRFSSPAFPGEEMRVELWRDGDVVSIRVSTPMRDKVIFNNGCAIIG